MTRDQSSKSSATNNETKQTAAKKYVDEQLALLKRHGSLGRLSKGAYNSIVNEVVRVTR